MTTLTELYVVNDLQQEIVDDLTDCDLDSDEQVTALRDLASGHDPLYQFFGMAVSQDYVTHTYHRLKAAICDQLDSLIDAGAGNGYHNGYRGLISDTPGFHNRNHDDFASHVLALAIWSAAGDLYQQTEY